MATRLSILRPRVATLDTRRAKMATVRDQRNLDTYAWQKTRERIMRRDNGVCQCAECKASGALRPAHEVDHIIPVWEGGTEHDSNLQPINRECHKRKTAEEAKRRAGGL